jgi:hypothetical protein
MEKRMNLKMKKKCEFLLDFNVEGVIPLKSDRGRGWSTGKGNMQATKKKQGSNIRATTVNGKQEEVEENDVETRQTHRVKYKMVKTLTRMLSVEIAPIPNSETG